jgi:hypothetical protein
MRCVRFEVGRALGPFLCALACTAQPDPGGSGYATASVGTTETSQGAETSSDGTTGESTGGATTTETGTESESESDTGVEEWPQVLAEDEAGARGIAVDATHVYWTNQTTGKIQRIPIEGGEIETIADTQDGPYAIAVDDTHTYWTNQTGDAIMRVEKAGGSPQELSNAYDPTGIAIDETDVYWLSTVGLYRVPKGGGNETQLAVNVDKLGGIALSSSHVYWTDHGGFDEVGTTGGFIPEPDDDPYLEGRVLRLSKAGGGEQVIVGGQEFPYGVDLDSQYVYWANNSAIGNDYTEINKIKRAPAGGGPDEDLATMQDSPWALVVLGDYVYYGSYTQVWRVERTGGSPQELASAQYLPRYLTVDNAHLFWANGDGTIMKLAFDAIP